MANDPQVPPDSKVLSQHCLNIRINMEDLSKISQSENLKVTNQAKQDTH